MLAAYEQVATLALDPRVGPPAAADFSPDKTAVLCEVSGL